MRLVGLILILILLFIGINVFLLLRYNRINEIKPFLNKKTDEIVGELTFPKSEENIRPKGKRAFLLFISRGKFKTQKITASDGSEIGDISILEGVTVDASKNPRNIDVIVQATLTGKNANIFAESLQDLAKGKNLSVEVESEMLTDESLEQIFPKASSWRIEFAQEPLDLKDPLIDPNRDFIKMFVKYEESGMVNYQELGEFISSGLKKDYAKPIFPFVISLP